MEEFEAIKLFQWSLFRKKILAALQFTTFSLRS